MIFLLKMCVNLHYSNPKAKTFHLFILAVVLLIFYITNLKAFLFLYLIYEFAVIFTLFSYFYKKSIGLGILGIESIKVKEKLIILIGKEGRYFIYIPKKSYDKVLLYNKVLMMFKQEKCITIIPLMKNKIEEINDLKRRLSDI